MNGNGFIKIHRQMLSWEWYTDINTKILFLHLLLKARYEDTKYKGRIVKRGSLNTTVSRLADETALTVKEVRTALKHLKSTGEVEIKGANRESTIKVLNYDVYQATDSDEGQTKGKQRATKGQPKGERTEKESKEGKELKKEHIVHFWENIWAAYPNKKGKGQVSDTQKSKLLKIGEAQLMQCIERYSADKPDWQKPQNGSTFFNSGYIDYLDENYVKEQESGSYKNGDTREDGRVFYNGKWILL